MENVVIEEIKQALRDLLVTQIEGIRGDIRALEARIEAVDKNSILSPSDLMLSI